MGLLKVYRPLEKFMLANFKFSLNSERKQFSFGNNPHLRLQQREISVCLSSSGQTPAQKTSADVLVRHRCPGRALHLVLPRRLSRTNLVNNPQQSVTDTTAVLFFPTNIPSKSAGVLVAPRVFASPRCSWRSGQAGAAWGDLQPLQGCEAPCCPHPAPARARFWGAESSTALYVPPRCRVA